MNLQFLKNNAIDVSDVASKVKEIASSSLAKKQVEDVDEASDEEVEEKGSKMLQVMDWAFEKANGNLPGLGTTQEMAQRYLDKYGSVDEAVKQLIKWQIVASASAGFATGFGGIATMAITLPADLASTLAIQLRMIGAIAELGGYHDNSEEKKTGMYLCLLGGEAGSVVSKVSSQVGTKLATSALKKLPGKVLTKINQRVGFRLLTKFGTKGVVNIGKLIPGLGAVIGGTIDAFSTQAIAKAAKALFLDELIESEHKELHEVDKIHLLINLARVDNDYAEKEIALIKTIVKGMCFTPNTLKNLEHDIEKPKKFEVDLTPFKEDIMLSTSTLAGLYKVARLGGISPVEQIYLDHLASDMGISDEDKAIILNKAK